MLDLKITGGTIVDGSGAAPHSGDVGVKDGKIVAIGKVTDPAKRTCDASGAIVTPGFVDVHTHYDGQAVWDQQMEPSSCHGVTSVMMGNCGVINANAIHLGPAVIGNNGAEQEFGG